MTARETLALLVFLYGGICVAVVTQDVLSEAQKHLSAWLTARRVERYRDRAIAKLQTMAAATHQAEKTVVDMHRVCHRNFTTGPVDGILLCQCDLPLGHEGPCHGGVIRLARGNDINPTTTSPLVPGSDAWN